MIEEELPDELENDLDDIEPVGDESQLYEHFRVVVDKGQAMVRVDKYLFERIVNASRNRIQKAAEGGFVMANGKPVKSSYKVKPLDVPLRMIPDVADNSSLRQAQAKLLSAGFKLNQVQLVNGEKDWVYGVKYQGRQLTAGEKIPMGASLTLMVGDGAGSMEKDSTDVAVDTETPVTSESSSTQEDSWF